MSDLMRRLPDLVRLDPAAAASWRAAGEVQFHHVTADSRTVRHGSLFVALAGGRLDGRQFIPQAVAKGAAAVIAPPGTQWPAGVPPRPLMIDPEPRLRLAQIAARMAGAQPATVVAVTGTNGKTSVVDFLRQIWSLAGHRAASLGTLGVVAPGTGLAAAGVAAGNMTTPDPVVLSQTLSDLARAGVGRVAVEASSHGLDQFRLDGLRIEAAGFTNMTRDHLDYHGSMDAYRAAKLRLFRSVLLNNGPAVASTALDPETMEALRDIARRRRLRLRTVGEDGDLPLLRATPTADGQEIETGAGVFALRLPGRFQADNVLVAAALAEAGGVDPWPHLPHLTGVRGRMELAARLDNGSAAYVDYAHTPDALTRLLAALRPHARRLVLVFGAGGDRDPGKRAPMGEAARAADVAIVTDDNPRSEDPAAIRAAVLAGCPEGHDGGGRAAAIAMGLEMLRPGDVLAVAGKGHEQGQTVAGVTHPFDDAAVIRGLVGNGPVGA